MPAKYEYQHLIHPSTMDGLFQGLYTIFGNDTARRGLCSIQSMSISFGFPITPGSTLTTSSHIDRQGFGIDVGRHHVLDVSAKIVAAADGIRFETSKADLDRAAKWKAPPEIKKVTSNLYWKPDVDKLDQAGAEKIFNPDTLITPTTQPGNISESFECSLPDVQRIVVPDEVQWRAYAAKWLELCGHKNPMQIVLQVTNGIESFARKAVDVLGGKDGATPVCSKYRLAYTGDRNSYQNANEWKPWEHYFERKCIDMYAEQTSGILEPASIDLVLVTDVSQNLKARYCVCTC